MLPIQPIPLAVVLVGVLIASVTDVWKFKVYNALTMPLLVGGLLYHGAVGGWPGLGDSVLGMLFGFACLVVFFVMGGMGAGDVKLMAAVGAWLGMPLTFYVFIASSLSAGAYSVVLLTLGRNLVETWTNFQILWVRVSLIGRHLANDNRIETEVHRTDRRRRLIPFAAMIAVGLIGLITLAWLE